MKSLLDMPPEIRATIWRMVYEEVAVPRLRYAGDHRGGIQRSTQVQGMGLVLACKQLYAEVRPVLLANIELHVIYPDHSPSQLGILPPAVVGDNAPVIYYHCGQNEWDDHRPPRRPFKFHRFPGVQVFRVTKATPVFIGQLRAVWEHGKPKLTRSVYESLSDAKRYRAWKASRVASVDRVVTYMANFGRGGWLSRVIDPVKFPEPIELEPDDDAEFDNAKWRNLNRDFEAENRIRRRRAAGLDPGPADDSLEGRANYREELAKCREVVSGMRVIVELEFNLSTGQRQTFLDSIFEVLLVVVDVRTRTVLEYRFLMDEEIYHREKWSQQVIY